MIKKLVLFAFLVTFLVNVNVSVFAYNDYTVSYYDNSTGNPAVPIVPSFKILSGTCKLQINSRADFTDAGDYEATISYYGTGNVSVSSSNVELNGNKNCLTLGTVETALNDNNGYESNSYLSHTAISGTNYFKSTLICNITGDFINFTSSNNTRDYNNYVYNVYFKHNYSLIGVQNVSTMAQFLDDTQFSNCGLNNLRLLGYPYNVAGVSVTHYTAFYYPFNSSATGILYYNLTDYPYQGGNKVKVAEQWYYYPIGDSSNPTQLCGTGNCSGSVSLDEDSIYVLMYYKVFNETGGSPVSIIPPIVNFSLSSFVPNYICGAWSDCESGLQYRVCEDSYGKANDKLEFQACYSLPEQSVILGFEDSYEDDVFYAYPQWWLVSCPFYTGVKSVNLPSDWTINSNYSNLRLTDNITGETALLFDYMKITDEFKTEGTKSLKLWSIPSSTNLIGCDIGYELDGYTCSVTPNMNRTYASYPYLEKPVNETYLLAHNMTFDYPNITISLDIKKCSEPEQQYAGNTSLFGFCGDGYYTKDKSINWDIDDSKLYMRIYDTNNSDVVGAVNFLATNEKFRHKEFYVGNLSTDILYEIQLQLNPDSIFSPNPVCVFVDNIEINGYEGLVSCNSYCSGYTRYEANTIEGVGCTFDVIPFSPLCFDSSLIDLFTNCADACICDSSSPDYLTFFEGDNSSGECEYVEHLNSSYCLDYCTEQQELTDTDVVSQFFGERNITLPDWIAKLLSPIMIIIYFLIVVMGILAYKTESWQIGALGCFLLLIGLAVIFPVLVWIAIIIIIIGGLVFGKMMVSHNG